MYTVPGDKYSRPNQRKQSAAVSASLLDIANFETASNGSHPR
jgi:hypothetical protein